MNIIIILAETIPDSQEYIWLRELSTLFILGTIAKDRILEIIESVLKETGPSG